MSDIPVEILRYEAKWSANGEWEECTRTDYLAILGAIHEHPYKTRAIGVVQDPAGLLLPGPDLYGTWQEAAIREKMRRVELERELKNIRQDQKAEQKLLAIKKILEDDSCEG